MGYREPEICPWLEVDLVSMESPGSLVASAASVDVASNGVLGNRDYSLAGVEAWQTAEGTPTFAVLGAAAAVPQFAEAHSAHLLGSRTGRIWIAALDSNRNRLGKLLMQVRFDF